MTYKANTAQPPSASMLSQTLFVLVSITIIVGGLWTLYMGDAPYHPEVSATQGEIFLASD